MARIQRSQQELDGAAWHLGYEIGMLRDTAMVLRSGLIPLGALHNAVLESFVIHARNSLHFLDPAGARPSDVLADDFLSDAKEWHRIRGDLPAALVNVRERANKQVAHLTYDRLSVTEETRTWNFDAIACAITERFNRFAELAELTIPAPAAIDPRSTAHAQGAAMRAHKKVPINGDDTVFYVHPQPDYDVPGARPGEPDRWLVIAVESNGQRHSVQQVPPGTQICDLKPEELERWYRAAVGLPPAEG